jgi:hypothetical protein
MMLSRKQNGMLWMMALSVALVGAACDKAQLLAPTSSTISASAATRTLPLGGTTEVSAVVTELGGSPVQNGTTVRFTTNLGTVNPVEAQTRNGIATTTFSAGNVSGTAEIRATSGAASGGTGAAGTTATNVATILVGAAAVVDGGVTVRALPSSVSANGGTVEVVATILGEGGRPIPNTAVQFSATQGSLAATTVNTDANGEARTTLTTTAASTVTARVGTRTGTVDVTVRTGPSVTLTCAVGATTNCSSATVGQLVTFTVARGTTTSNIRSARLDFGDGQGVDLGTLSGTVTISHAYTAAGTYTATLTATDVNGETTTATQIVQVRGVVGVTVTATNNGNRQVTATATLSGSQSSAVQYEWTFEGSTPNVVTTTNQATYTYGSSGAKTISVRVTLSDGSTATGSTSITVP